MGGPEPRRRFLQALSAVMLSLLQSGCSSRCLAPPQAGSRRKSFVFVGVGAAKLPNRYPHPDPASLAPLPHVRATMDLIGRLVAGFNKGEGQDGPGCVIRLLDEEARWDNVKRRIHTAPPADVQFVGVIAHGERETEKTGSTLLLPDRRVPLSEFASFFDSNENPANRVIICVDACEQASLGSGRVWKPVKSVLITSSKPHSKVTIPEGESEFLVRCAEGVLAWGTRQKVAGSVPEMPSELWNHIWQGLEPGIERGLLDPASFVPEGDQFQVPLLPRMSIDWSEERGDIVVRVPAIFCERGFGLRLWVMDDRKPDHFLGVAVHGSPLSDFHFSVAKKDLLYSKFTEPFVKATLYLLAIPTWCKGKWDRVYWESPEPVAEAVWGKHVVLSERIIVPGGEHGVRLLKTHE